MGERVFSCLNWLVIAAFASSAAMQLNDPDPAIWVAIYGMATAAAGLHGRWTYAVLLAPLSTLCAAAMAWPIRGSFSVVPVWELVQNLGMRTTAVEESRELGGMLLIIGWMIVLMKRDRLRGRAGDPPNP